MKTRIHVDQHAIRRNKQTGGDEPVISVKTYLSNRKAHNVEILGPSRVVYSPDKPLSCGARVWIETDAEVKITVRRGRKKTRACSSKGEQPLQARHQSR